MEHSHRAAPALLQQKKIGVTFTYCLMFIVSLTGKTIIEIIVYKTKTMRKPINFLIVNMAMSDLLYPIILILKGIQRLYIDSWLISCQALCKLVIFVTDLSAAVSIQNLFCILFIYFILEVTYNAHLQIHTHIIQSGPPYK